MSKRLIRWQPTAEELHRGVCLVGPHRDDLTLGMVSELSHALQPAEMGVDQAFSCLRSYARSTKRRLVDVAGEVVSGAFSSDQLLSGSRAAPGPASEGLPGG